jgi:hypothetical protein
MCKEIGTLPRQSFESVSGSGLAADEAFELPRHPSRDLARALDTLPQQGRRDGANPHGRQQGRTGPPMRRSLRGASADDDGVIDALRRAGGPPELGRRGPEKPKRLAYGRFVCQQPCASVGCV